MFSYKRVKMPYAAIECYDVYWSDSNGTIYLGVATKDLIHDYWRYTAVGLPTFEARAKSKSHASRMLLKERGTQHEYI